MARESTTDVYSAVNMRREDKRKFDKIRGSITAVQFIADIVKEKSCAHPAEKRVVHVATYREDGQAINMTELDKNVTVRGFYCKACGKFLFPKPI